MFISTLSINNGSLSLTAATARLLYSHNDKHALIKSLSRYFGAVGLVFVDDKIVDIKLINNDSFKIIICDLFIWSVTIIK